jgi:hypothetical protein
MYKNNRSDNRERTGKITEKTGEAYFLNILLFSIL